MFQYSPIFVLEKTSSGWNFGEYFVRHGGFDTLNNLAIDAAGNLYGTGWGAFVDSSVYSYIFKASYANGGWHYQDLEYLFSQFMYASGNLALDPNGNLYGTTYQCGAYGDGTVWQLSP